MARSLMRRLLNKSATVLLPKLAVIRAEANSLTPIKNEIHDGEDHRGLHRRDASPTNGLLEPLIRTSSSESVALSW